MTAGRPPGRIITFYSYKGGTGRSMALANVAWVLASAGKSVLVIDWDLEAPGLHRYFRPFLIDKELTASDGLIDFIIHYADTAVAKPPADNAPTPADWYVEYADITDYALSLNFGEFPPGGKIDFVPAGRQGTTYATRVNTFDWQKFYTRLGGETFLEAAKDFMRKYDYVLIDSRTGVSDTSGICTVQMPDVLVVCFTLNNQSIEGAAAVAQSSIKERAEFVRKRKERSDGHAPPQEERDFRILPIPMRAELNEKERLDRRRRFAKRRFNPLLSHIPTTEREAYWGDVQVPYIPYYAFEEMLSPFIDDPADKLSVLRAMVQICHYLTDSKVSKFDLIISSKKKDEVLKRFALAPDEEAAAEAAAKSGHVNAALLRQIEQADELFSQLTEDEKKAARRLWTRLVRVPRDDERALNSGVTIPLGDLDPTALHLARDLTEAKLLVINKDDSTGEATVGVMNEELLRQWPQLLTWISEDREFLIWRQRLREHVAQWEKDRRSRFSLLSGRDARRAQEKLRERPADLSPVEKDYIERSARQRRRLLFASATAACVTVVTILAVWGYNAWQAKARVAVKLSQAVEQFDADDPKADMNLGMLLAIESLRASGDMGAERLLRENITRFPLSVASFSHDSEVDSVTFSGESGRLTTVSGRFGPAAGPDASQKFARVWDISSGQEMSRLSLNPAAQSFAVDSAGRYVAVMGTEGAEDETAFSVLLYDLNAPGSQPVMASSHSEAVSAMTFSPRAGFNGRTLLATAGEDGMVRVFDVSSMKLLAKFSYPSAVVSLAFGSARYLVLGTDDNRINTCDLNAPGVRGGSLTLDGNILMVASSPDDSYFAALLLKIPRAREALVLIRPIKDSPRVPLGVGNLNDLTFSPDGRFVAAAGEDGWGHLFSLSDGENRVTRSASLLHGSAVDKMIFSEDGKYVATIGLDRVVKVWETGTGRETFRLTLGGNVNDLAFSPDGQYVAIASADQTARVWHVSRSEGDNVAVEACGRLSRNLTPQEWSQYFGDQPYRKTCENLP